MEGEAGPWFQILQHNNLLLSWQALANAMEKHFRPSPFDSPRSTLFKLHQVDSISHYYTTFASLSTCVEGLIDEALLDCFISGLKPEVKREVLVQSPPTLLHAVALAKLYDAKLISFLNHPKPRYSPSLSPNHQTHRYPTSISPNHQPIINPSSLTGLLPAPSCATKVTLHQNHYPSRDASTSRTRPSLHL